MLIHGRLILTQNGLMLDEVRSLLQKALRRKERNLIERATNELLGYGKDQLPWKSLMTFLFEDQCLSDWKFLSRFYALMKKKDKFRCVELLYHAYTCRIAACIPVVAIDTEYEPNDWNDTIEIPRSLTGLVAKQSGELKFDLLLAQLQNAWLASDTGRLLTCIKLATIVHDHEKRSVTNKGEQFFITKLEKNQKPNTGLLVISALYKATGQNDTDMKKYLQYMFKIAAVKEAPIRLILSCIYTQKIWGPRSKQVNMSELQLGQIEWKNVPKLDEMPGWAVDKHTFRGKYGKGTKHLVKHKPEWMTEELYDVFHGDRPKTGVQHFFDVGCICEHEAVEENPFWERTKEIYYSKPHKLQKTVHMTAVYYKDILKKYRMIAYISEPQQKKETDLSDAESDGSHDFKPHQSTRAKRKRNGADLLVNRVAKRMKLETPVVSSSASPIDSPASAGSNKMKSKQQPKINGFLPSADSKKKDQKVAGPIQGQADSTPEIEDEVINSWPLLQLPTGSGKVYTRLDIDSQTVYKGPYKSHKISMVAFFHEAMKEGLGDLHTLPLTTRSNFVTFPLLRDPGAEVQTHAKDYYDVIGRKQVKKGLFVTREALGITQLHNLSPARIADLPLTIWLHFACRFFLNIGDSGLYNAITDSSMSFVYGIDMEEVRKNVKGNDVLNLMFVKLPRKMNCDKILVELRKNKTQFTDLLKGIGDKKIRKIAVIGAKYKYNFDVDMFRDRLCKFRKAVESL